ncbi:UNVERIFIED_CONTAM: hypothetical protein GTU68_023489 [Idotea baltica]|nr:hypothetical protein [Idotea baltica]
MVESNHLNVHNAVTRAPLNYY